MPQKKSFQDSKIYYSLVLLSADEWKQLGRWLQSPWCNSNKKLVDLYSLLKRFAPEYSASALSKEYLFGKLYPEKDYNDRWMRNILAELNGQIESFLVHQRLEEAAELRTFLLAKEWERRQAHQRLLKLAELYQRRSSANKRKSWEDYLLDCYWNDLLYYRQASKQDAPTQRQYLHDASQGLDRFYLHGKMKYTAELKGREQLINERNDIAVQQKLIDVLDALYDIPANKLYKLIARQAKQPIEEDFASLQNRYSEKFAALSDTDRRNFYFYLLNMRIRMYLGGAVKLQSEIFDLYAEGLKKGLLLKDGQVSEKTFLNAVTLGNLSGAFERVKSLIQNYSSLLHPQSKEDAQVWAHAHCCFHQGNFRQSIDLLKDYKFTKTVFDLHGRMLLLQSYFEVFQTDSSYWSFLQSYAQAFDKYIRRLKHLSDRRKKGYLQFTKHVKKIAKLIESPAADKTQFQQLLIALEQEEELQGKKWLTVKIKARILLH